MSERLHESVDESIQLSFELIPPRRRQIDLESRFRPGLGDVHTRTLHTIVKRENWVTVLDGPALRHGQLRNSPLMNACRRDEAEGRGEAYDRLTRGMYTSLRRLACERRGMDCDPQ
jgi:hypothetical protein